MTLPILLDDPLSGAELKLWRVRLADGAALVEGGIYKYQLQGMPPSGVCFEPSELFEPDPDDARTGRFLPKNHVGAIRIVATASDGSEATFSADVAPTKLDYETEYRAMLTQVADHAAEAVLQGFAPTTTSVGVTGDEAGELRYRAFAFLAARLRDATFRLQVEAIFQHPHRRWVTVTETRPVGRGLAPSPQAIKEVVKSGRRVAVPPHLGHLPLHSLPVSTEWRQNVVSHDTPANRFVRHAFERWRGLAADVLQTLDGKHKPGAGPQRRGQRDAEWVMAECDRYLANPVLRDAGRLQRFPHGDPVLLRQAGYRDVLRTYALADASIALDAVLPDDAFAATQRNVATLYEYWCFLVLVDCLDQIVGGRESRALFDPSESGLSLVLRRGRSHRLRWGGDVRGRRLSVDLWFNRQFSHADSDDRSASSWAGAMQPDVSLRIRPLSARPETASDPALDVWLHFDAKYRVQATDVEISDEPVHTAKRSDLLKMHAYRDAIRRSAGAYVLYPGSGDPSGRREFHEILPGIGAFPLRPSADGASGADELDRFLREILDHASNQASAAERAQFWLGRHATSASRRVRPSDFLTVPPADEQVLIGYVREPQWQWVRDQRRYNVRADSRAGSVRLQDELLRARLVLLWAHDDGKPVVRGLFERVGPWQVVAADDLRETDYPVREASALYLVCEINAAPSQLERIVQDPSVLGHLADVAPRGVTWEHLCSH